MAAHHEFDISVEMSDKIRRILQLFQRARGSTHVTSVYYGNYAPIPFIQAAILDRIAFEVQKAGVVPGLFIAPTALQSAGYEFPGKGWTLRWDGGKNHGLWNCFNDAGERCVPEYMTTYEVINMNLLDLHTAVSLLLESAESYVHTRRLEASRLLKHTQDIDFIDESGCTMVEVPADQFGPGDHWNDDEGESVIGVVRPSPTTA